MLEMGAHAWWITGPLLALGLVGTVLPLLPGILLILAAAILHYILAGPDFSPVWWVYVALLSLTALSFVLEWLASAVGTKQFGGGRAGMVGAVAGGIIGIFFGPPGILIGPFAGALLAERFHARKEWQVAGKAATGAVLGLLVGLVGKVAVGLAMVGIFVTSALTR